MNLLEILRQLNVDFCLPGAHRHVTLNFYGVDCLGCSPGTRSYKRGISLDGRSAPCWTCGPRPVVDVLAEISGRSYGEIKRLLAGLDGYRAREQAPRGVLKLPVGTGKMTGPHRDYLAGRGFDPDTLERLWGLQGTGPIGPHAWRVVIPVVHEGRTVSWTTRAIRDGGGPRYVTASPADEELPAKSVLYGGDMVRHSVIVHEGPADVWRTGSGAVATMGLSYTKAQLLALSQIPKRLIVFDRTPEAQRRAGRLCQDLAVFPGETLRAELEADDPGSAGPDEVESLREFLGE